MTGGDGQHMRGGIILERDLGVISRDCKGNIVAVLDAALTVVHIPAFVERHFALIAPGGQRGGLKGIDAITVHILQPGAQTVWLPVAGTTQFLLEAAGGDGDDRAHIICDPVALVVIIEFDRDGGVEAERDICRRQARHASHSSHPNCH